ncbi:ATP-binding cassette domain-containing protein [Segetibacter sp. 3557_3]|uniref:ABC transporter ATP-binding protein n=1 Tax=Segetibacter sp. 3557_3 TaxID=2547429 RepID=UPI0010589088|nr:ATP-binding cassette domain-containing protein [Segetibacter sp. 3557_3]TDH25144.1 ATP-binding cassette domain-containing protein [Segetibacter sp. 3557_3]
MIKLTQVSKLYNGNPAVNNISFEVKEGENMVLLGTSGCGKTTTLRMINRLVEPSAGIIEVNGTNVGAQQRESLRRGIGYVLQHNGLFPHYTIAENIGLVPTLLKWSKKKTQQRSDELLEKLHLPPAQYGKLYPGQLSGGQQQRVGLARALAANPPVLLMDEPFGALDPVTRTAIKKEFSALEEFRKKTIVLVTHDVQEAFELGDRICLMDKGEIVQTGSPAELLFKPANAFVSGFLNNNRLSLELQALTLNDVFALLPPGHMEGEGLNIQPATTLWSSMEQLASRHRADQIGVVTIGATKHFDIARLMGAFTLYKTRLHG